MDSFSILCDEFSRLPTEEQDEEIEKLSELLGGIRISRNRNETADDFRNRTFAKGLGKLPEFSEFEEEFFDNRIIPSLIDHFKESSDDIQEKLMDKLSELTDGISLKRKSDESESRFRIRFYSRLLCKLPAGSQYEMVEFARQVDDSDEESKYESDENDDSDEDSYDDSTSTRSGRRFDRAGKDVERDRDDSTSSEKSFTGGEYDAPVEVEIWNDGGKKAGFNSNLKFKGKSGSKSKSNPNPYIKSKRIPLSK